MQPFYRSLADLLAVHLEAAPIKPDCLIVPPIRVGIAVLGIHEFIPRFRNIRVAFASREDSKSSSRRDPASPH